MTIHNTATADKPVFAKSIFHNFDHQYDFRIYADGRQVVNVWHYGDDTEAEGVDMGVDEFIAEYGCKYAIKMAEMEYQNYHQQHTDNTTPSRVNERPAPSPILSSTIVSNSAGAGSESRPGSVIVEGWEYEKNYQVAQTAIRHEAQVTDLVLAQLKAAGIELYHLVTKDGGNRYRAAWDLLEDGKYSFTGQPDTALLVASSDPKHPEPYRVWTNGTGRQCDCRDHSQRMEQHGGFCKHVLLLEIIQAVAVAYRLNNPVPPTATANSLVA